MGAILSRKGEMMEAMYLESWYEGDPIHETMRDTFLVSFGYILGGWESEGLSLYTVN